jgi:VCBS repeat-containing protein
VRGFLLGLALVSALLLPAAAMAGTLEAPTGPDTQVSRYTLKHVYDLLRSGTEGTALSGPFVGPGSSIASTITTLPSGNTLNDIYNAAPKPDGAGAAVTQVCSGKKFFSLLSGAWGLQTGSLDCNQPPVAVNDTETATEGQTKSIAPSSLLSNDTDPDGDTKRMMTVDSTSRRGGTITSSGSPVTSSFTYDPGSSFDYLAAGQTTVDAFTYTMDDSNGHTRAATVFVTVTGVNDAPVLSGSGFSLTPIMEGDTSSAGDYVSAILGSAGGVSITDADLGALTGMAVTGVSTANGTWEYSTNNGSSWSSLGSPTASAARLLNASAKVRFVPTDADWFGVDSGITFRAWDTTSGSNGGTANTSSNGGSTAFSSTTATAGITVIDVNDPPSFDFKSSPNASANAGDSAQSVSGQATNISGGPNGENSSGMTFIVSVSNTAIFSVLPAISSAGALTYTPHATNTGTATVRVRLIDSGSAVSSEKTFTITIN